jgi:hypothetical protein
VSLKFLCPCCRVSEQPLEDSEDFFTATDDDLSVREDRRIHSLIFLSDSIRAYGGSDLAEWLERLAANAVVDTVLDSIPVSSDTVESEGQQMKQCWIAYIKTKKNPKNPPFKGISL